VVLHSYRHRLGLAAGGPAHARVERRLAVLSPIAVSSITLDGAADGVVPATDGTAAAMRFTGRRRHRVVPDVGHNLPAEAPGAFSDAVWEPVRGQR
jgi:pimeloyl-ACP methyl ester carboxylesterase